MISIVLASCRSRALLEESLAAILPQAGAHGAEVIVARTEPAASSEPPLPPSVRLVHCPATATIPEIRGAGLVAATGEWVALTEDNCVAGDRWIDELAAGFDAGTPVVGGAMENARPERAIDCGAGFAEYGFFGPGQPAPTGNTPPLVTGANVAYHRTIVGEVASWALAGDWEDVIHHRLAARGLRFRVMPAARVGQNLHYDFGAFCRDRYEHGRDYARVRSRGLAAPKRLVMAAATPLLPPLLASRIWRSAGRAAPATFGRALPWTLAFLTAWAVGEAVGYLVPRTTT